MLFEPSETEIDMADFPREYWSLSIYGDVKEDIPPTCPFSESGHTEMPAPRGLVFTITVYVDCDMGDDCVTFRSRNGFAVFLYGAPIYWVSKKQSNCKDSTYGSEPTETKQAGEYVRGLRYKLLMMSILCEDTYLHTPCTTHTVHILHV